MFYKTVTLSERESRGCVELFRTHEAVDGPPTTKGFEWAFAHFFFGFFWDDLVLRGHLPAHCRGIFSDVFAQSDPLTIGCFFKRKFDQ